MIVPIAIQNVFYYHNVEKNIQDEMLQRMNSTIEEKAAKLNGSFSGVITLTRNYKNNEMVYRFLDRDYESDMSYYAAYQDELKELIITDLPYHLQVKRVLMYTDNPTLFNGGYVRQVIPDEIETLGEELVDCQEEWIGNPKEEFSLRIALENSKIKKADNRSISIVRSLEYYPQYSHYKKVLRVDLNTSYLRDLLCEDNSFENMILVDSAGRIIVSANTYSENGAFDIFNPEELPEKIVVLKKKLNDFPLTLFGFYDSNVIAEQFNKTRNQTLMITAICICFASFCILIIAGNITKRTLFVVRQSKQIAQGNFIQVEDVNIGEDEIGVLQMSMNQMSEQLKNLIEYEYNAKLLQARLERETAQAKLLALQSQVNPHFMFNALESIRLKALAKQERETANMIKYMSRMFRHLINWDEDIIYLEDDIKFLDEFLAIQKYRFEDEFSYYVNVEEGAKKCLLPKLIIQPLVENACVHGVGAISNDRIVIILAQIEQDWLKLTVEDNGGGMTKERLIALKNMLHNGTKLHISVGLNNVYQRLLLYYGDGFYFDVESVLGKGTICTIKIPVRYE